MWVLRIEPEALARAAAALNFRGVSLVQILSISYHIWSHLSSLSPRTCPVFPQSCPPLFLCLEHSSLFLSNPTALHFSDSLASSPRSPPASWELVSMWSAFVTSCFSFGDRPQLCIAHLKPRVLWPMWVPIICPPKSPPGLLRTQLCLVAQPMGNPGFPLALGPFTIAAWACEDGTHRCVVPHPWAWQEEEAETLERGGCYSWPHLLGVLPSNSFSHQPGLTLGLSTKLTQVHFASL